MCFQINGAALLLFIRCVENSSLQRVCLGKLLFHLTGEIFFGIHHIQEPIFIDVVFVQIL